MLKKHVVSVRDMVKDIERGILPSKKMLDEKITDRINYGLLLEGLFRERMHHEVAALRIDGGYELSMSMEDDFQDTGSLLPPPGSMRPDIERQVYDLGFLSGKRKGNE